MVTFKTVLFTIRKCIFQSEVRRLKRSFFYSATWNSNSEQEVLKSECNNEQEVFQSDYNSEPKIQQGDRKVLNVAMLGLPNVGKSTLVNKLIRRSICPTSSKVHTTMHKAEGVYTEGNTQIIFMDTPGLTKPKEIKTYKLSETFKEDPRSSINKADVIGIIQDVTNVYTRHKFDDFFIDYLTDKKDDAKLLLIFNKVDRLKKKHHLLDLTRLLTSNEEYPKFNDIFMVSALTGDGIDDLRNYLLDSAKVADWKYQEGFYTDQSFKNIVEETVRAKLLDILPHEMPYKVKVKTEHFGFGDDGSINSVVTLECPREAYVRTMLKHKAFKVRCLTFYVERDLRHAFRTTVIIRINVSVS